jgi:hypothetical protein
LVIGASPADPNRDFVVPIRVSTEWKTNLLPSLRGHHQPAVARNSEVPPKTHYRDKQNLNLRGFLRLSSLAHAMSFRVNQFGNYETFRVGIFLISVRRKQIAARLRSHSRLILLHNCGS